jgi:hypothetical protein
MRVGGHVYQRHCRNSRHEVNARRTVCGKTVE